MEAIHQLIGENLVAAWCALAGAFFVLAKSADLFVDSSISLAHRFRIPKLVIGIVLVSIATTAPELSVSLMAAIQGRPELALGNAIGSIICNFGLGLALCAVLSAAVVPIIPHVFNVSGGFLLVVSTLAFVFTALDGTLSRGEGLILILLFAGYLAFLFRQHKRGRFHEDKDEQTARPHMGASAVKLALLFGLSLGGIIASSHFVILSATSIARAFGVPEAAIALTLVALGTSIPEVAMCATAARKNEGALAVGNILGANIMNICWVAGFSSLANDLTLARKEIFFMFPAMFVLMIVALALLRRRYRLTRNHGFCLFTLYLLYLASFFVLFPPS